MATGLVVVLGIGCCRLLGFVVGWGCWGWRVLLVVVVVIGDRVVVVGVWGLLLAIGW